MRKLFLVAILAMATLSVFAQNEMTFVVEGAADSYNQVRIINETSMENFQCRVAVFNEDKSAKGIYGFFELKEKGDSDSNTRKEKKILPGSTVEIQFPTNITKDLSFHVEYLDNPFFSVIVIHLTDKIEYEEDN